MLGGERRTDGAVPIGGWAEIDVGAGRAGRARSGRAGIGRPAAVSIAPWAAAAWSAFSVLRTCAPTSPDLGWPELTSPSLHLISLQLTLLHFTSPQLYWLPRLSRVSSVDLTLPHLTGSGLNYPNLT